MHTVVHMPGEKDSVALGRPSTLWITALFDTCVTLFIRNLASDLKMEPNTRWQMH